MSETISKSAVCEIIADIYPTDGENVVDVKQIDKAYEAILQLPSAQPEQKWIPCNERLPGEHEWLGTKKFGTTISNEVYVTFEASDGQRFAKHISFQNGKLSPVDEQRMKVLFKGAKPIAWMPLPEPYREERTEE